MPSHVRTTIAPAVAAELLRRVGGIMHLPKSSSETIAWHLAASGGGDFDLTDYPVLELEFYTADGEFLFERTLAAGHITVVDASGGDLSVTFTPANLQAAGTHKYEFWGTKEGGEPTLIARGSVIVEPTFGPGP